MSSDLAEKFDNILAGLSALDGRLADVEQAIDAKGTLGFRDSPSRRRILYANRTNGHLWYFWDRDQQEPIGVEKRCLRGWLTDVWMYEKGDDEKPKVSLVLDVGTEEISVEFGATATAGRGIVAALNAMDPGVLTSPITIQVNASDPERDQYDSALLVDVYGEDDAVLTSKDDWPPKGAPDVVAGMVESFREQLGWTPHDAYDAAPEGVKQAGDSAAQETGAEAHSETREPHPSEKAYDTSENGHADNGQASEDEDPMPMYDPQDAPSIDKDAAYIGKESATRAWKIAQDHGHTKESFVDMLDEAFGVDKPQNLDPQHWDEFWSYLDREYWEANRQAFEPDDELPF